MMFRRTRRSRPLNKERIKSEYNSFQKKMNSTKHAFWFEVLNPKRKFQLFLLWKEAKHTYALKKKAISFNKFMFAKRQTKQFHVPTSLIRDNALNKILN